MLTPKDMDRIKFYIASKYSNGERCNELAEKLQKKFPQLLCSLRWWDIGREFDEKNPILLERRKMLKQIGLVESFAARSSEFLIYLVDEPSRGAHVEIGIAMGTGKPIFFYDEGGKFSADLDSSTFFQHGSFVERHSSLKLLYAGIEKFIENYEEFRQNLPEEINPHIAFKKVTHHMLMGKEEQEVDFFIHCLKNFAGTRQQSEQSEQSAPATETIQ